MVAWEQLAKTQKKKKQRRVLTAAKQEEDRDEIARRCYGDRSEWDEKFIVSAECCHSER